MCWVGCAWRDMHERYGNRNLVYVRFILTGGERNDITQIEGLLEGLRAGNVLAEKGYDGQRAMDAIAAVGAKPVVPRRTTTAK